jgi:hypothetical protein
LPFPFAPQRSFLAPGLLHEHARGGTASEVIEQHHAFCIRQHPRRTAQKLRRFDNGMQPARGDFLYANGV